MKTWINDTPSLFDLPTGIALKEQGISVAVEQRASLVIEAREVAIAVCKRQGTVNADDVAFEMEKRGYGRHAMKNAMGGVFQDKRFRFTGVRVKSKRPWAHANELKSWELV